jgi:hypothetical protein
MGAKHGKENRIALVDLFLAIMALWRALAWRLPSIERMIASTIIAISMISCHASLPC